MNFTPWTCQNCHAQNVYQPSKDKRDSPVMEWKVAKSPGQSTTESVYVTCPHCRNGQMIVVLS